MYKCFICVTNIFLFQAIFLNMKYFINNVMLIDFTTIYNQVKNFNTKFMVNNSKNLLILNKYLNCPFCFVSLTEIKYQSN